MFEVMLVVEGKRLYPNLAVLGAGVLVVDEGFFSGDLDRGRGIKDL
jgi:hypothetical protein